LAVGCSVAARLTGEPDKTYRVMKIVPVEGTAQCPTCQGAVTVDPNGPDEPLIERRVGLPDLRPAPRMERRKSQS